MAVPKHQSATVVAMIIILDACSIFVALAVASIWDEWTAGRAAGLTPGSIWSVTLAHLAYFIFFALIWPIVGTANHLYISRRRDDLIMLSFDIVKSLALALIFCGFAVAFYTHHGSDPTYLSHFGLCALFFLGSYRILSQLAMWQWRSHGHDERQILLIGVNERALHLVNAIYNHPHYGYKIMGLLEDDEERCSLFKEFNLPFLGKFDDLEKVLREQVLDEIYICLPVRSQYERIQSMAYLCEGVGVGVRMIADLFPLRLATSRYHKFEGIPILALSTVPENQPQLLLQRFSDLFIGGLALICALPLFLITALLIKLESRGPVFFYQERVGINQRRFKMYKFRSMVQDAEAQRESLEELNEKEGPIFKVSHDPRVTRIGRFIRKYSIDELPQIFNVLKGDMSLVGPRPPLPSEVEKYSWSQRRRLSVKPGMTGLSQVSGRSKLSFTDTVDLDLYYIDQWSLALVFRILLLTIPAVLKGRGAM